MGMLDNLFAKKSVPKAQEAPKMAPSVPEKPLPSSSETVSQKDQEKKAWDEAKQQEKDKKDLESARANFVFICHDIKQLEDRSVFALNTLKEITGGKVFDNKEREDVYRKFGGGGSFQLLVEKPAQYVQMMFEATEEGTSRVQKAKTGIMNELRRLGETRLESQLLDDLELTPTGRNYPDSPYILKDRRDKEKSV